MHNISGTDWLLIQQEAYPRSLSEGDKTVLHLARKLETMVLSSDGVVRAFAKKQCIECHGMIWILDRLLEKSLLAKHVAGEKLRELRSRNRTYRNNLKLTKEIEDRLK